MILLYICEVSRVLVKFIETGSRVLVARGWGRREQGIGLMGTEFQWGKVGKSGDGRW